MTNLNIISSNRPRSLDPGALTTFVDAFANDLKELGHTPLTVAFYADSARHFAAWLGHTGIVLTTIDDSVIEAFAHHDCRCGGARRCNGFRSSM